MMMKRMLMMMMIIINRQPVIKWCLTGRSALWDSSERARPLDQYELHLGERVQALCPSMHWEGGREISAADTSGELHPSAARLLASKRVKFSCVFVHAVVPLRKTWENVPASSNLSCVFIRNGPHNSG